MIEAPTPPFKAPVKREPSTRIKPSEALRLGRLTRPIRCDSTYFRDKDAACALGAIAEGWGIDVRSAMFRMAHIPINIAVTFDIAEQMGLNGDDVVIEQLEALGE